MDIPLTTRHAFSRKPLAALGKLSLSALVALAAFMIYLDVVVFQFDPRAWPFIVVTVLLTGVVATGCRAAARRALVRPVQCDELPIHQLQSDPSRATPLVCAGAVAGSGADRWHRRWDRGDGAELPHSTH